MDDHEGTSSYPDDRSWIDVPEDHPARERLDYVWIRPGDAATWCPSGLAQAIFSEPVTLPDGTEVSLSDHDAIAVVVRLAAEC